MLSLKVLEENLFIPLSWLLLLCQHCLALLHWLKQCFHVCLSCPRYSYHGTRHHPSVGSLSSHEICVSTMPLPFLLYKATSHSGWRTHCVNKYAFISVWILITSAKTCSQIRPCSQAPGSQDVKAHFGGKTI